MEKSILETSGLSEAAVDPSCLSFRKALRGRLWSWEMLVGMYLRRELRGGQDRRDSRDLQDHMRRKTGSLL